MKKYFEPTVEIVQLSISEDISTTLTESVFVDVPDYNVDED